MKTQLTPPYKGLGFTILESLITLAILSLLVIVLVALLRHSFATESPQPSSGISPNPAPTAYTV